MNAKLKIGIAGIGLIGGSLAKAFKKYSPAFISAFDRSEILQTALEEKVIDKAVFSIEELTECEIIFLSLPVDESLAALRALAPLIDNNTIITDVCGVKEPFDKLWKSLSPKGIYIGGHPMTGKEKSGYLNSDPLIFENAVHILTHKTGGEREERFIKLLAEIGCRIKYLSPEDHDKITASVSHLPQLAAVALMESLTTDDDASALLGFAGGGFRDMTRIASSSYEIWKDIFNYNDDKIINSMDEFILKLNEFKKLIREKNHAQLELCFKSAAEKRNNIPLNSKGFLNPLFDLLIFANDKPGVLSRMTTALFKGGINIKDIELLKIREGSGGAFKLSFETLDALRKAKEILAKEGFSSNE